MHDEEDGFILIDRAGDWKEVIQMKYRREIPDFVTEYPHKTSITIDLSEVERAGAKGIEIANELITSPDAGIQHIRDAVRELLPNDTDDIGQPLDLSILDIWVKQHYRRIPIRNITAHQLNKLVTVEGIIRKAHQPNPTCTEAVFRCMQCGTLTQPIKQSIHNWQDPYLPCSQCEKNTKMELFYPRSKFRNYQAIEIGEHPENMNGGATPYYLHADVTGDLCGSVMPGDRVLITGIIRPLQRKSKGGIKTSKFDYYLECLSIQSEEKSYEEVQISEEDEAEIIELSKDPEIREKIARSIAPSIYGHPQIKAAAALQLFGGTQKTLPDGSRRRGDIHMLLVGDPGIAKSQILRYVVKTSPRGIVTSGKGSTAAGLTAAATRDPYAEGRWILEAGALVLADKGIACIDELDKMREEDRSSLHEAMEDQTVSIAKAGINATLRSRCSVLGAANPIYGKFDEYAPLSKQINMPPSLLSRFDLIFIMRDIPNETKDRELANHILNVHAAGQDPENEFNQELQPEIRQELLRKYIKYAKEITPVLSTEARDIIKNYYVQTRSESVNTGTGNNDKPLPITPRQPEAVIRLSEASARTRLSDTIAPEDAMHAIQLIDECLRQVAYDPKTGKLDMGRLYTDQGAGERAAAKDVEKLLSATSCIPEDQVMQALRNKEHSEKDITAAIEELKKQGTIYQAGSNILLRNN